MGNELYNGALHHTRELFVSGMKSDRASTWKEDRRFDARSCVIPRDTVAIPEISGAITCRLNKFLKKLVFISAGRRPSVTLEKVLKFVTGSEAEPVLGYGINPHIAFDRFAKSCLPTSNTCVNKLTLPVGDMVPQNPAEIYAFFDYAFSNDFFGNI